MRLIASVAACVLSATALNAVAANVPAELKKANTDACLSMAGMKFGGRDLDPHAPKQKDRIPAYCSCVSDAYWAGVPQAEFDAMMKELQNENIDGPAHKAVGAKQNARLEAAQKKCAKS